MNHLEERNLVNSLLSNERFSFLKQKKNLIDYDISNMPKWLNLKSLVKENELNERLKYEKIDKNDFNLGIKKLDDNEKDFLLNYIKKMDWFQYFEKLMCTFEEVDNNAHKNGIYEEIDMSYVIRPFIYTLEKNIYSTIKSLKNFNVSENAIKQILNTYTTKLFMFFNKVSTSIQVFIPVIVFIYGSYFIDKKQLTIGSLIAFNTVASSFIMPLISLSNSYSDILALKIYLNKLYDILNTEQEQSKKEQIKIKKGNIKIDNLYFRYSKLDNDILKGISLRIKAGEKVAIVGKSGSGKSTLIKLIIELFKYDRGSIKIDNVDINHINIQNYRTQLGVVLQEPQIFNGTLKDNILLGKKYDHEKMNAAVKISNIENLINSMPMGLDTIISEDGINLSGGQRQRISLARAIYNEPKIIIMDEPTSSLDNESEKEIIDNIFKLNNTCLIISHRFYNIEKFDKIILINKGKIEDIGSHNELIIRNNTYQKMYCIKNT